MDFRTELNISPSRFKIDHSHRLMTIGSCFANVIGIKLKENKFNVCVNPFGVLFNPHSIFKALHACACNQDLFTNSYVESGSIWYNYDLHSDLSAPSKDELQQKITTALTYASQTLQRSNVLTITLGTAFVYRIVRSGDIVANCHKVPAATFVKELLNPFSIAEEFSKTYSQIQRINPSLQILLTVSPVRHIKDGIPENSLSKSILRTACHFIQEKHPEIEYFPSYEIMMDDLRDYRFYKEDMIHPTEVAENYIWEKFTSTYINKSSQDLMNDWRMLQKAIAHKPFHPKSEGHQKFLKDTIVKLERLQPLLNVQEEIEALKRQLTIDS